MWELREKLQWITDNRTRDRCAAARALWREGMCVCRWAPHVQPVLVCAAKPLSIPHLVEGWQFQGLAGELCSDGLSKLSAGLMLSGTDLWTRPCGELACIDELWKREILIIPATWLTVYWLSCECAFVLKAFAPEKEEVDASDKQGWHGWRWSCS